MGRLGTAECDRGPERGAGTTLAAGLSLRDWLAIQKSLQLSMQQGDIVRLMMTLPGEIVLKDGSKAPGNSNARIALAMSREREARYGRGGVVIAGGAGAVKKGTGPVAVEVVDTQMERVFKRLNVHSRMELAQRVDYEIAVMRGWVV